MLTQQADALAQFRQTLDQLPSSLLDPERPEQNLPFITAHTKKDEQRRKDEEKLWLFFWDMCDPASALHQAFAQEPPIRFTYSQLEAATGISKSPLREAIARLDRGSLGPVRLPHSQPVELLLPTRDEMWQFMDARIQLETNSSLLVHRSKKFRDGTHEPDQHLKCYLQQKLAPTLSNLQQLIDKVDGPAFNYDPADPQSRILFEEICYSKTILHKKIFDEVCLFEHAKIVRLLRYKMRMWHSYVSVTLDRLRHDDNEHNGFITVMLARHDGDASEAQVRGAIRDHLYNTVQALLAVPYPH